MSRTRIYFATDLIPESEVCLPDAAATHVCKVLRLSIDDELTIFDGHGNSAIALLKNNDPKNCVVRIQQRIDEKTESGLKIHLGLGISKGDRMDYAIQKSVEAGVHTISPLITERTVVKLDARREQKRIEHWQGVIIAACEQSGRSYLPEINTPQKIHEWLGHDSECKLVFDCAASQSLNELPAVKEVSILVGPEGGLSETEIDSAVSHNFVKSKLGPRTLRTESAAAISCAVLQMLWGDYRN